jgi:hypothetical protein
MLLRNTSTSEITAIIIIIIIMVHAMEWMFEALCNKLERSGVIPR